MESGCLKFDKKNYQFKIKRDKRIKIIGILTHLRAITGSGITKFNIPFISKKYFKIKLLVFRFIKI